MKQHPFSLIEITIAMGVVAIGVVAVVGAFPAAANKSRDAMTESYAAGAAGDLLAMIEQQGRSNWSAWFDNGGSSWVGEGVGSPPGPDSSDLDNFDLSASRYAIPGTKENLWAYSTSGSFMAGNRRFKIIRYVDDKLVPGGTADKYDLINDMVDFEAIMVVWREQVKYDGTTTLPYAIAVRLNAEISWPAQVPYDRRQKAFYATELFKR